MGGHKRNIAEDEVLIGVYGTLGKANWFTKFGFIVNKKVASIWSPMNTFFAQTI